MYVVQCLLQGSTLYIKWNKESDNAVFSLDINGMKNPPQLSILNPKISNKCNTYVQPCTICVKMNIEEMLLSLGSSSDMPE